MIQTVPTKPRKEIGLLKQFNRTLERIATEAIKNTTSFTPEATRNNYQATRRIPTKKQLAALKKGRAALKAKKGI